MPELRPLACDQELGRSVVEALALQLPDGGAQFENLGAQFQDPVVVRVFLHRAAPNVSAAGQHARRLVDILHGAKTHPVADVRQDIAAPGRLPFVDEQVDFSGAD
ncbi:hypothetical protein [Bradyrhizobium genosp. SA-3]|uniref:hypothetical protein n=1 Tax=Bradyrhizobium genosp. SA-3 TaxID=508868 RepID=UPI0013EECC8B